jgi:hypothetical protein
MAKLFRRGRIAAALRSNMTKLSDVAGQNPRASRFDNSRLCRLIIEIEPPIDKSGPHLLILPLVHPCTIY